jgi:type I restriction enzyme, S subunit
MKTGWEEKKLGEICIIRPPKSEARKIIKANDFVSFVPMEDLGINQKELLPTKERVLSDVEGSYTYFADGDVLLAKITPCFENGKLGIAKNLRNGIGFGSSEYIVFRTNELLNNEYLYYFLSREDFRINGAKRMTGAVGHKRVAKDYIEESLILLPPLPEQKRIVTILDEAFTAIAKAKENAEKNLNNAKNLFESCLKSVFENTKWIRKTLGDVCEKVEYGSSSKSKEEGEIAVLRMGNIQNGRFIWDKLVYSDDVKDNKQYLLKYNDVLFNRTNSPELVGKTAIYKGEMPAIFAGYLIRIHRKENLLDANYLNYYLNSEMAMTYGKSVTISSVNQANINGTKLKSYPIPLPPLKDQQTIVTKLDALSSETKKLETIYQQKLANLDELKKSILQKAFAGELSNREVIL